jgi:hypothetical protein
VLALTALPLDDPELLAVPPLLPVPLLPLVVPPLPLPAVLVPPLPLPPLGLPLLLLPPLLLPPVLLPPLLLLSTLPPFQEGLAGALEHAANSAAIEASDTPDRAERRPKERMGETSPRTAASNDAPSKPLAKLHTLSANVAPSPPEAGPPGIQQGPAVDPRARKGVRSGLSGLPMPVGFVSDGRHR